MLGVDGGNQICHRSQVRCVIASIGARECHAGEVDSLRVCRCIFACKGAGAGHANAVARISLAIGAAACAGGQVAERTTRQGRRVSAIVGFVLRDNGGGSQGFGGNDSGQSSGRVKHIVGHVNTRQSQPTDRHGLCACVFGSKSAHGGRTIQNHSVTVVSLAIRAVAQTRVLCTQQCRYASQSGDRGGIVGFTHGTQTDRAQMFGADLGRDG